MLRTFVGLHLRDLGGWISIGALLELLAAAGVSNSSTRSAVSRLSNAASRLKGKGLLIPDKREGAGQPGIEQRGVGQQSRGQQGVAGYRLDPAAVTDLERGDRRIFSYRGQKDDESWCLVSYSLPEVDRSKRVQLRRALMGLGFGAVTDGLWIAPGHLRAEVEDALEALEARAHATIFITQTPVTAEPFGQSAAKWWDLDRLAAMHTEFLERYEQYVSDELRSRESVLSRKPASSHQPADPRDAFVLWLHCVDDWKTIPYVDPGLPASALPADWPGTRSVELFVELRAKFSEPARAHVRDIAAVPAAVPGDAPEAVPDQPSSASSTNGK